MKASNYSALLKSRYLYYEYRKSTNKINKTFKEFKGLIGTATIID
ncbi:hypothetical protein SCALIN_C17_0201 [Candidatus Scalindua japonica]|uniref:Uncharacterized protein n=1 Tax=Candidatus Scalindua japonica TaxID=1284222 RepID=A0A286TZ54_9BACT|nr:hypothetical protein SCALIN_C17_0201 [Candidatus Scalindua japonica]